MSETPGSKILGYFAMHYEGVYIRGQDYTFLSLVIYASGLWLCIKKTGTVNVDPGSNDEVWVLSSTSAATAEYLDVINTLHGLDDSFDARLQQANDAKSAAEAAKTEALGSASQAAGSAQAAQIDKDAAQVAAGQAQISANEAAGSANDANASKLAAQSAAGSAQGSASAAAESKSAAESAMAGAQEAQAAAEQTAADFQGIVNLVGAGNPNLLHNGDFRNPVNQRGVSGEISSGTYFFDRWIRNSGTVTVAAAYLTLASGAVVEQRIEGNLLAGVICTVSFEVGSTIFHGSGVFPTNNGTASVEVDGYPNITFGCATGYMFVMIPATSNTSIKRFKCEMGFASTLHLDPPMDHAVELPKCQRFYIAFPALYHFFGVTHTPATSYRLAISLPVIMRITPSTNLAANKIILRKGGAVQSCTSLDEILLLGNEVWFICTIGSGLSIYTSYNGRFEDAFYLSADL